MAILAFAQCLRPIKLVFGSVSDSPGLLHAPADVLISSSMQGCVMARAASLKPARCSAVMRYHLNLQGLSTPAYSFCGFRQGRLPSRRAGQTSTPAPVPASAGHLHKFLALCPLLIGIVQHAVAHVTVSSSALHADASHRRYACPIWSPSRSAACRAS